jgi:hypothetical protein
MKDVTAMPHPRRSNLRKAAGAALLSLLLGAGFALPVRACYGAAAMGLGGAYTSLAEGVLAVYWNQAGLAFTEGRGEVALTLSTPADNINYNSFTGVAVKPAERLGLGFGQTRLASWAGGETWNTVAVGYRLSERWAVGGAYRQVAGKDPHWPYRPYANDGFDLSAQYRAGLLNFGLLAQDVGGPSATNPYWQNVRPSVSLQTEQVTLAFDVYNAEEIKYAVRNEYNRLTHQVGLEYRPFGQAGPLALRGGFYHGALMYGFGLKHRTVFLDVAAMPDPKWPAVQITGGVRF